jgi:hypothetical protein
MVIFDTTKCFPSVVTVPVKTGRPSRKVVIPPKVVVSTRSGGHHEERWFHALLNLSAHVLNIAYVNRGALATAFPALSRLLASR